MAELPVVIMYYELGLLLETGVPDLHWSTVSDLTRTSADTQSLQILESNDQNNRYLFLSLGFFALRLYTVSCCPGLRIRAHTKWATRLNEAKTTRLRNCTTTITVR